MSLIVAGTDSQALFGQRGASIVQSFIHSRHACKGTSFEILASKGAILRGVYSEDPFYLMDFTPGESIFRIAAQLGLPKVLSSGFPFAKSEGSHSGF